jgi:hypothetical protein
VTVTGIGTWSVYVTLPIASAFTLSSDARGSTATAVSTNQGMGGIQADDTGDRLVVYGSSSTGSGASGVYVSGQYIIK